MLAKEGSNRCCTGHFVVSFSLSLSSFSLPFMIRFYLSSNPKVWFTMVPYAVCGLGIVVRPTLFVPPSVCLAASFFPSSPVESRRTTTGEKERDEKSTLPLPSLFVKSFFPGHSYREMSIFRRISIQRPFRSAPLPISPPG